MVLKGKPMELRRNDIIHIQWHLNRRKMKETTLIQELLWGKEEKKYGEGKG